MGGKTAFILVFMASYIQDADACIIFLAAFTMSCLSCNTLKYHR